jgi:hypothetical protein
MKELTIQRLNTLISKVQLKRNLVYLKYYNGDEDERFWKSWRRLDDHFKYLTRLRNVMVIYEENVLERRDWRRSRVGNLKTWNLESGNQPNHSADVSPVE